MAQVTFHPDWFPTQLALKGLNQEQFQAHARVSSNALSRVNAGKPIRSDVAGKIVAAFNRLPDIPGMAEALGAAS